MSEPRPQDEALAEYRALKNAAKGIVPPGKGRVRQTVRPLPVSRRHQLLASLGCACGVVALGATLWFGVPAAGRSIAWMFTPAPRPAVVEKVVEKIVVVEKPVVVETPGKAQPGVSTSKPMERDALYDMIWSLWLPSLLSCSVLFVMWQVQSGRELGRTIVWIVVLGLIIAGGLPYIISQLR